MPHIILTEEQARVLAESPQGVEVQNPQGQALAFLKPFSPEDAVLIAEAKRRLASPGPRIPSERVQAFLEKLHEIDEREGIDREKVQALLHRVVAGEPL